MIRMLYEKLNSEGAAEITIPQVTQLRIIEKEGEIETVTFIFMYSLNSFSVLKNEHRNEQDNG